MATFAGAKEADEAREQLGAGGHVRQALVLINPTAGKKAGLPTNLGGRPEVEAALTNAGIAFETLEPESTEDMARQAKAAAERGVPLVIAAGGDGTVQHVAFALMGSETALGIMPLGSFNNVARSLGIPRDLAAAGAILREGATARIDVGLVGNQHFLEAAGIGLDAAVMPHSNALGDGRLSALRAVLNALVTFRKGRLTITVDGRRRVVHAFMVTVANAPYALAGLQIAPEARMDDQKLDVVVYQQYRRAGLFLGLIGMLLGRRVPAQQRRTFQGRRFVLRGRRPWPVQADAHLCGNTPVTVELAVQSLRVVHGSEAALMRPRGDGIVWEAAASTK